MKTEIKRNLAAQPGFTLIEVLIVVAIVAILAAIAVPNYTGYVQRGKITEATAELATLRTKLEQKYQDNRKYGDKGDKCSVQIADKADNYFTYECTVDGSDDSKFVAVATNKADKGMGSAGDFEYRINETGAKTTVKAYGLTPSNGTGCWISRKGDSC